MAIEIGLRVEIEGLASCPPCLIYDLRTNEENEVFGSEVERSSQQLVYTGAVGWMSSKIE